MSLTHKQAPAPPPSLTPIGCCQRCLASHWSTGTSVPPLPRPTTARVCLQQTQGRSTAPGDGPNDCGEENSDGQLTSSLLGDVFVEGKTSFGTSSRRLLASQRRSCRQTGALWNGKGHFVRESRTVGSVKKRKNKDEVRTVSDEKQPGC